VGDIVLKLPAVLSGAYPTGWVAIVSAVVTGLPAAWLMLFAAGLIRRDATTNERADMAEDRDQEEEDEEEDDDGILALGALTHWWLSTCAFVRRMFGRRSMHAARDDDMALPEPAAPTLIERRPAPRIEPDFALEADFEVAPSLDEQILKDASAVFSRGEKMQLVYDVRNTDRAVGTRISSAIVRKFGPSGLNDGQLTLRLNGSAGQSLGAFAAKGLRIELEGDANDYVGKGLSGAVIAIRPFGGCSAEAPGDSIIGNTVLYGATSGTLFAAGGAGQRFAVRNSGATVVVEGCGANGCEYMTGGVAVILGKVGDNFAAGMTGGEAFVLDEDDRLEPRLNGETVFVSDLEAEAEHRCRALIEAHVAATGSRHGAAILADWERRKRAIRHIRPHDVRFVEGGGVAKLKA
jgi:glutamate synthase domain-containing protein 3